ncbi:hypothetical protein AX16_009264 [Volvariella volvacea WC 439]|nr:hypothetical protein AX16_009264 [Volvariella volvacea WC 439]
MRKTPWTGKAASAVPSDFIRSTSQPNSRSPTPGGGKGKGKQNQAQEPPKSKEVKQLESFIKSLRHPNSGKEKDPKGGCFCQAREHKLSPWTPICTSCGLILCSLNTPQYPVCPHCSTALLSTVAARNALIERLEQQRDETIAKEIADREREVQRVKQAEGAFPSLSGSSGNNVIKTPQPVHAQQHKVLSLTSTGKSKKVVVSSYTSTPAQSRPASSGTDKENMVEEVRVPPPPRQVPTVTGQRDPGRPWQNLLDRDVQYIPLPQKGKDAVKREKRKKNNPQQSQAGPS